jgi:hypothetical protein
MKILMTVTIALFALNLATAQEKNGNSPATEHRKTTTTTTVQKRKVTPKPTETSASADEKKYQTRSQTGGILTDDAAPGAHDPNHTGSVTPRVDDPAADPKVTVPVPQGATGNPNPAAPIDGSSSPTR